MKVYLHSTRAEQSRSYPMHLAPADDVLFVSDAADSWKNQDGTAKQITIDFCYGTAEVPEELGKYMIARGIAHKSRLLRRISQLFDRNGDPIEAVFDADGKRIEFDMPGIAAV